MEMYVGFFHGESKVRVRRHHVMLKLSMGRRCVEHYSQLGRVCVFSHDELLVAVAGVSARLQTELAVATRDDLVAMVGDERRLRARCPPRAQRRRLAFELLADEQRQCAHCATTCYLSSAHCACRLGERTSPAHPTRLSKHTAAQTAACACATWTTCAKFVPARASWSSKRYIHTVGRHFFG